MELMEPPEASSDTAPDAGPEDSEWMHQLQEGLTPEQQNMITSLTSMLKS